MQPVDRQLAARLADAFAAVLGRPADQIDPQVRPAAEPRFGDYQSNAAMALAKQAKMNPRQLAQQAVAAAKGSLDELCEPPEVAGPGFINLRLKPSFVAAALATTADDPRLGVQEVVKAETVVIDFSSPNIAKEMHVGHIRSTVLGDVLARILEFQGHQVRRQNHVGDWGTQFGMLLAYLEEDILKSRPHARVEGQLKPIPVVDVRLADLEDFYRQAKQRFDSDAAFADKARLYVTKLQSGNERILRYWRMFRGESLRHCEAMYSRLGVALRPEDVRGESAYNDDLPVVVAEFKAKGLLTESEGAQCVFIEGFANREGNPLPFMVQKSDGGFLYATTDLAALRYRVNHFHPDRILYVVDSRQAQHFAYLFAVARKAGLAPENVQLVYIPFGTVQGPDGRPFKTKAGESVKLSDVLDEAEQRALAIVQEKNPQLSDEEKKKVARAVGVGAIKYFDLSNNRVSDYRFDWDRMLSLTGNTAPYLQYAYARIRSIFRKLGTVPFSASEKGTVPFPGGLDLESEHEIALGKHLIRYGETLGWVVADYRPNLLCDYLYELANRFSGFYENCPVLKADPATRAGRLLLCDLTARVLAHGLGLLGIGVLEQM